MIPRLKADLSVSDLAALFPSFDQKGDIERFENSFAKLANQKHAIAFPYGRTALIAILMALDGDKIQVICPSYTCVVVPHAVVKAGFEPVFVDVAKNGYNMDWNIVDAATNENTRAIIATSVFGEPVDQEAIARYQQKYPNIPIIQDCAHGFFAGQIHKQGIAAFYGLNISKIITSIFGGMITTDDSDLDNKIRACRSQIVEPESWHKSLRRALYLVAVIAGFHPRVYGLVNKLERSGLIDKFTKYHDPSRIDLPSDAYENMCPIEARIGERQTKHYHDIVAHRIKLANIYRQGLSQISDFIMPPDIHGSTYSHFVIRTQQAKAIKATCLQKGVQLGDLIDYEIPDMPCYINATYYGARRSRDFPSQVINLPVHKGVTEREALKIIEIIKSSACKT